MSQSNSLIINLITEYTEKFESRIKELESENLKLKSFVDSINTNTTNFNGTNCTIDSIQQQYASLLERHKEIKASYMEAEKENTRLYQEVDTLKREQSSLKSTIEKYFSEKNFSERNSPIRQPKPEAVFSKKSLNFLENQPPSDQKMKHKLAKSRKNLELLEREKSTFDDYDTLSDSDMDIEEDNDTKPIAKKLNFDYQNTGFKDLVGNAEKNATNETYDFEQFSIELLKKLIENNIQPNSNSPLFTKSQLQSSTTEHYPYLKQLSLQSCPFHEHNPLFISPVKYNETMKY